MPDEDIVDRAEIMRLSGVNWKKQGDWWLTYCPAHNDGEKHNHQGGESLGISHSRGVMKCFASCSFSDIMAIWRLRAGEPLRHNASSDDYSGSLPLQGAGALPTPIRQQNERLTATYLYANLDGEVLAEKGRFERPDGSKSFKWRKPGADGWPGIGPGAVATLQLYGAGAALKRPEAPVYFVEGEKACEACWQQGLVAVTAAGGASQVDFGNSLDILAKRRVFLWADNDAPGAKYMALIRAKLAPLQCQVEQVMVDLPPKGDAADYFARGGLVEDIVAADPGKPVVSLLAEDSVLIKAPTAKGPVTFLFEDMDKKRREFACRLTVTCFSDPDPYVERLNLDSNSGVTQLRRDLDTLFGKDYEWIRVLNKVMGLAREAYLSQEHGREVSELPVFLGEVLLVDPLVVNDGPTIFFGDGACIAGETLIETHQGPVRVDALAAEGKPVRVWALGPDGPTLTWADAPYHKGRDQLYAFATARGLTVTVTAAHRFLTPLGWRRADSLSLGHVVASQPHLCEYDPRGSRYVGGKRSGEDAHRSRQIASGLSAHYWRDCHQCGERLLSAEDSAPGLPPSLIYALSHSRDGQRADALGDTDGHTPGRQHAAPPSRRSHVLASPMQAGGEYHAAASPSKHHSVNSPIFGPSPQDSGLQQPIGELTQPATAEAGDPSACIPPLAELTYDTITAITHLGEGDYYDLSVPHYENYLANGLWHHNSLKSYIAFGLGLSMSLGLARFTDIKVPFRSWLVIDYEDSDSNFHRRLDRLAGGIDPALPGSPLGIHYWSAGGTPLVDLAESISRYCQRHGITGLIIDSAAPACGGDPLDHSAVLDYFGALKQIGLTSITIAHVTKVGDTTKPFGSAYWHNEARRTWYVMRVTEEDSDEVDVGFYNRKVNDGRVPAPLAFHVSFSADERGPVSIFRTTMERSAPELLDQTSNKNRVWVALGGLPRTIPELAEELGLSTKTVDNILRRGPYTQQGQRPPGAKGGQPSPLWARLTQGEMPETSEAERSPGLYFD